MLRLIPLLTAALLALPAAAQAGTVTYTVDRDCAGDEADPACFTHHRVRFAAGIGETNDVRISVSDDAVVISDTGVAPIAGTGCVQAAPDAVRCEQRIVPEPRRELQFSATVDLADGDDRADVGDLTRIDSVFLQGGIGNDVLGGADRRPTAVSRAGGAGVWLDGADGDDVLLGGGAPELLFAGQGDDEVHGGAGDDFLDASAGTDVLDGGGGRDLVSYDERRAPVTVDLADPGPDGQAGEGDTLTAIEDVRGGSGDNVLRGDDGPNRLDGSGNINAADRIEGRGGADDLRGNGGRRDRMDGGAGDDRLSQSAGARAPVCGAGRDILVPARTLRPPPGCERVLLAGLLVVDVRPLSTGRRSIVLRVRSEAPRRLRGILALSVRGRRVSRGRTDLQRNRTTHLRLRMGRPLPRGTSPGTLTLAPGGGLSAGSVRLRLRR